MASEGTDSEGETPAAVVSAAENAPTTVLGQYRHPIEEQVRNGDIWDPVEPRPFFGRLEFRRYRGRPGHVVCWDCVKNEKFCTAEFRHAKKSGYTNFRQHMRAHHPRIIADHERQKGKEERPITSYLQPGAQFQDKLLTWIASSTMPVSVVEDAEFRDMIHALKPNVRIPCRRTLLEKAECRLGSLQEKVRGMADGQAEVLTFDGWTSRANDTYYSTTRHWITSDWQLKCIPYMCEKFAESTTSNALKKLICDRAESMEANIFAIVTDCEASMVACGRELGDTGIEWIGCADHRIHIIVRDLLEHSSISSSLAKARAMTTHINSSSQAWGHTSTVYSTMNLGRKAPKPKSDTPNRWWSTADMVTSVLVLRETWEALHKLDEINLPEHTRLSSDDWKNLHDVEILLKPFKKAMKHLESDKVVTNSAVLPIIYWLRKELEGVLTNPNTTVGLRGCVKKALEQFNSKWGGEDSIWCREGPRRQPCGFTPCQLMATALDPRFAKRLDQIMKGDKVQVFSVIKLQAVTLAKTVMGTDQTLNAPTQCSRHDPWWPEDEESITPATPATQEQEIEAEVDEEIHRYCSQSALWPINYNDSPLEWWKKHHPVFPCLARVARHVLAIPATSASSERLFSRAGSVITPKRNRLASGTASTFIALSAIHASLQF